MGEAPRSRKGRKTTSDSAEEASLLCEDGERPTVAPKSKFSPVSLIHSLYQRVKMSRLFARPPQVPAKEGAPGAPATSSRWTRIMFICNMFSNKSMTPMQRVYLFFGLRQGTMLIAIHDMLWCSFLVFLLVLGTAHAREVTELVEADAEENAMREGLGLFPEDLVHAVRTRLRGQDNDAKLHHALHMATVVTLTMFLGIGMAGVDMIASMMLLAGAVLRVRQLMMPWLSIRLLEMMLFLATLLIMLVYFPQGTMILKIGFLGILVLTIIFYHWLVAYSLHEHLCMHDQFPPSSLTHRTSAAPQAAQGLRKPNLVANVIPQANAKEPVAAHLLHQYHPHHHHNDVAVGPRVFLGYGVGDGYAREAPPEYSIDEAVIAGPRFVPVGVPPEPESKLVASAS